jgi:hypothetical protein
MHGLMAKEKIYIYINILYMALSDLDFSHLQVYYFSKDLFSKL